MPERILVAVLIQQRARLECGDELVNVSELEPGSEPFELRMRHRYLGPQRHSNAEAREPLVEVVAQRSQPWVAVKASAEKAQNEIERIRRCTVLLWQCEPRSEEKG